MRYNACALGNRCEDSKPLRETPTLVGGLRYIQISTLLLLIVLSLQPPVYGGFLFNKIQKENMSIILVDAKYVGHFLKYARIRLHMGLNECSSLFGISVRELRKIEKGKILIPKEIINKIMVNGLTMIVCQRRK